MLQNIITLFDSTTIESQNCLRSNPDPCAPHFGSELNPEMDWVRPKLTLFLTIFDSELDPKKNELDPKKSELDPKKKWVGQLTMVS